MTPGARSTPVSTASTVPITAVGKPTAVCRPSTAFPTSWRRLVTYRCSSTPGSVQRRRRQSSGPGRQAVGIGRPPYATGAALAGTDGIVHVLRSLLAETDLIMAIDGYPTLGDLTPAALRAVRQ